MPEVYASQRSYAGDVLVVLSMIVVACAVAIGLIREMELAPVVAWTVAGTGFLAAVIGHALLSRNEAVKQLQTELAQTQPGSDSLPSEKVPNNAVALDPMDLRAQAVSKRSHDTLTEAEASVADGHNDDAEFTIDRDEGLARLRVNTTAAVDSDPRAERNNEGEDIAGIIQRLADDIANGRRNQDGVSVARYAEPKPMTPEDFAVTPEDLLPGLMSVAPETLPADDGPSDATDKLAAVASALSNERIDVFLEPIHGLADRQPRHYEVTVRLALGDGENLGMVDYSKVTRGTTLLPLIDAVKVSQAKKVGLQLLRRGQSGALISRINGESVTGSEFGDDLATIMGSDHVMSERLVLSFSQNDVRGFTPAQWMSMDRLGRLGFRFAVAEITDLDMDFELLGRRGFTFAKLDAEIFVEGLRASHVMVPPTDVCRHLASTGLTLIVDHLENDRQLAEVLGFGALFGQGELFGGPHPVKAEVLKAPNEMPLASHAELR